MWIFGCFLKKVAKDEKQRKRSFLDCDFAHFCMKNSCEDTRKQEQKQKTRRAFFKKREVLVHLWSVHRLVFCIKCIKQIYV